MAICQVCDTGMAVFLPLRGVWPELRAANKRAVLAGKPARRFFITGAEPYYLDAFVAQALESDQALQETLTTLAADFTGCSENGIHCVALYSTQSNEGVLVHREQGQWIYAWIPLLSMSCVETECHYAEQLHQMAHALNDSNRRVSLSQRIWRVSELLEALGDVLRST